MKNLENVFNCQLKKNDSWTHLNENISKYHFTANHFFRFAENNTVFATKFLMICLYNDPTNLILMNTHSNQIKSIHNIFSFIQNHEFNIHIQNAFSKITEYKTIFNKLPSDEDWVDHGHFIHQIYIDEKNPVRYGDFIRTRLLHHWKEHIHFSQQRILKDRFIDMEYRNKIRKLMDNQHHTNILGNIFDESDKEDGFVSDYEV
jgi:hypothetical protein